MPWSWIAKGEKHSFEEICQDIRDRDHRDMTREICTPSSGRGRSACGFLRYDHFSGGTADPGYLLGKGGRLMKVVTAKTAGFCFGVQRAVDKVYELISQNVAPIYTLGPIIHNEGVVRKTWRKKESR